MVGDPKQLPATVLSDVASKYLYQCSMFERLQKAGHPVTMLTKQYRMHPEICRFPSLHFYDGNLVNGDGMSSKEKPFHKTEGLGPYLFFDIADGQELHGKNSGSLYNECEADAAVELVRFFRKSYPSEFIGGRIGIITPYRSQLSLLRSRFSAAFGSYIMDEMELNTVDGFQGREVDILVVSTVRAGATEEMNSRKSIGFVADVRRMNVALTRAKHSLWILGNVRTLQTNKNWGALVNDAKDRNLVLSVKKPYVSIFNSLLTKSNRASDDIMRQAKSKKKGNELPEQGRKFTTSESKRGYPGHDSSSHIRDKNKKAKMQYDSSTKRDQESVHINKTFKDAKPVTDEHGHDSLSHIRDKKKAKMQYDSSTKMGQESEYINKTFKDAKLVTDEHCQGERQSFPDKSTNVADKPLNEKLIREKKTGSRPSSQVDDSVCKRKQQREAVADKPLNEKIIREKKTGSRSSSKKTGSRSSSQVDDPVCKRKQQREAVDALLPSAFISSKKKPESSSKYVPDKRSSSAHEIRPAKTRKGIVYSDVGDYYYHNAFGVSRKKKKTFRVLSFI
ncbi:helicase Sen1 [Tanacetum coccineum]